VFAGFGLQSADHLRHISTEQRSAVKSLASSYVHDIDYPSAQALFYFLKITQSAIIRAENSIQSLRFLPFDHLQIVNSQLVDKL
jgi:hypothetical protein